MNNQENINNETSPNQATTQQNVAQPVPQQVVQQPQIQTAQAQTVPTQQPVQAVGQLATPVQNNTASINQQMQAIPNVEQNVQSFVENTQAANTINDNSEKKGSLNIVFIIILFAIIFAAMFFLFPYLLKRLG